MATTLHGLRRVALAYPGSDQPITFQNADDEKAFKEADAIPLLNRRR
jgi:hypothetical protein